MKRSTKRTLLAMQSNMQNITKWKMFFEEYKEYLKEHNVEFDKKYLL